MTSDDERVERIRDAQRRVVQPDETILFLLAALDAAEARIAALCEAGDALLPAIEETDFIWMDAAGHYELRCQICDAQAMGTRDRAAAIEHRESCEVRAWRALRGSGEPTP